MVIGKLNPDTMEQIGDADVFGDFNASGYLNKALKLLNPQRDIDIPNFKAIVCSLLHDNIKSCCKTPEIIKGKCCGFINPYTKAVSHVCKKCDNFINGVE